MTKKPDNTKRLKELLSAALARKALFPIELALVLPSLFEGVARRMMMRQRIDEASVFAVKVLGTEDNGTEAPAVIYDGKVDALVDAVCLVDPTDDEIARVEEYAASYRPKEFAPSGDPIFRDWGIGLKMAAVAQLDGLPGQGLAVGGTTYFGPELNELKLDAGKLLHRLQSALGEMTFFANSIASSTNVEHDLKKHQRTIDTIWMAFKDLGNEKPRDPRTYDVLMVLWLLDHCTRGERWGDDDNTRDPEALLKDFKLEIAESIEMSALAELLDEELLLKALSCWRENHGKWEATAKLLAKAGLTEASGESLRTTWSKYTARSLKPTP